MRRKDLLLENSNKSFVCNKDIKYKDIKFCFSLNCKEPKRNAYGYKNFDFFRLRLLYILNGKLSGRSKKMINKKIII